MSQPDNSGRAETSRSIAYVLILAGSLWLLAVSGFVPAGILRSTQVLWPLALIGFGLDLVSFRKLPAGIPYSFVALLAIAVAGLFFPASGDTGPSADLRGHVAIGDANRAEINVDATLSSLLVRGGAAEGLLVEGIALGATRLDFDARGRAVRRVDVTARGVGSPPGPVSLRTDTTPDARTAASTEIRLTDRVPIELSVVGREAAAILDLSGLDLAGFTFAGASGPSQITLGSGGPERYDAHVVGGNGPIDLTIAEGARLNLRLEPGPGGAAVAVGTRSDLTLVLRAGNGPVSIGLPENARVRVLVEDPGQGILSLSDRLHRVRGSVGGEESDVYETPGYRDVIPTIDIRIEETGAGPVAIR